MARDAGDDAYPVIQDLLKHPQRYSFFQAVRLLRLLTGKSRARDLDSFTQRNLRVRAMLSLGLPASDLTAIEQVAIPVVADAPAEEPAPPAAERESEARYRLTASFLGLYGPSSPLPTTYTEELFDEANEDLSVTRDFLDILGDGYFADFFRSWAKYRLMNAVIEEQSPDVLTMLYCLLGLGHRELRRGREEPAYRMLRYIGLFSQYPRSAVGLEILLRDFLGARQVHLVPNLKKRVGIPLDQRCQLGVAAHALGEDAYLGEEIWDGMGAFLILIEDVSAAAYYHHLPRSKGWGFMHWLIKIYVQSPLNYDMKISLRRAESHTATLGGPRWSGLGYDTWLLSEHDPKQPIAYLPHQDAALRPLQSRDGLRPPFPA